MGNIVYLEDCMVGMNQYPDQFFDLAICDVPYGINVGNMPYLQESKTTVKQRNGSEIKIKTKTKYSHKEWDKIRPSQQYFDELKRISKHQIIFGINYMDWEGVGTGRIRWDKGVPKGVSFNRYEYAYCSLVKDEITIPLLWSGMMQAKSVSDPMIQQGNKKKNEKRIHPCHKPVFLYDILLNRYGFDGMKLLDTHVGGGSIRISADKINADFIGYEIDSEYYQSQEDRFLSYKKELQLNLYE